MIGGEAISDPAMLEDGALAAFFDWNEIAHSSTLGRRLAQTRWSHQRISKKQDETGDFRGAVKAAGAANDMRMSQATRSQRTAA